MATKIIFTFLFLITSFFSTAGEYQWKKKGKIYKLYLQQNIELSVDSKDKKPKVIKKGTTSYKNALKISAMTPVFSDSPNGSGRLRAPVGGIIVKFKDSMSESEIKDWAANNKFNLQKKLDQEKEWIIESPAGIESLNMSNKLNDLSEIKSATPVWWINIKNKELKEPTRKITKKKLDQLR